MVTFLEKECDLKFFHNNDFIRKKCLSCNEHFWTIDPEMELCGDQPCIKFSFIDKPLGKRPFTISEIREKFLSFFEKNGHSRLEYPITGERCPVVARWRSDIYLTIASIADFQPHVTSGTIPPPKNPLVISQPCIRLNDLDEIGVSGRHLTTFEMMGHHAFNKNKDEIYFKEETVKLCDKFFTEEIGITREKITYKEQLWYGGGNAGPCLEVLAGGLEIATLVFMNMKEDESGSFEIKEIKYSKNPLNIVDTGYGLERIVWVTQGFNTIYEAIFPDMIKWIKNNATNSSDSASIFSLVDHTKCLSFMLGDGIVPSNVKAGYLARLIIRRSLRFIEKLKIDLSLEELVKKQLEILNEDFPSLLKSEKQIREIIAIETKRYHGAISKGRGLVKRILKEKTTLDKNDFVMLYDTHGMQPEVVKKIAENQGIYIEIPENFDSMVAELHSHEKKVENDDRARRSLPSTEQIYYTNHYAKEFEAKVLWKNAALNGFELILDRTTFYPEGGGQPADKGFLTFDDKTVEVLNVYKEGNSIIHFISEDIEIGSQVHGEIDWDHRYTLMKHHTGTHVVNGALRQLFGEHIWQAGSQLGVAEARFDFSHYKSISDDELLEIEKIANEFIHQGISVRKKLMNRNDAEKEYGFRLYQGGVPPGNTIRVLDIPGIDVEACGGTHLNNISEIEKIRVIKAERIQDGVNRIVFAAGFMVDVYHKKENILYEEITTILEQFFIIHKRGNVSISLKKASKIFSVPANQLKKTINRFISESNIDTKTPVQDLPDACLKLFELWKNEQKNKKTINFEEIELLKNKAYVIPGTNIKIVTAISSKESTITAGQIIKEPNFVAHIYDGIKVTSAASENVEIDFRDCIAEEIGKILGGSGGGRPKLTQSGGPKKDRAEEALEKAKELTIEALS